jgi:hypothetical protein
MRVAAVVVILASIGGALAFADTAIAATGPDTVIAADPTAGPGDTPPAALTTPAVGRVIGIDATIVNGLIVSGVAEAAVTLTARGHKARTVTPTANAPAVFRRLIAGVTYTVSIDGARVGTGVPVAAVGPAYGLTVSTTATDDEVLLRWNHTPNKGEGRSVNYDVVATPIATIGRTTEREFPVISGNARATVTTMALDPRVKYAFTITPRNSASTGTPSTATMTRTLAEMGNVTVVPTIPAPPVTPSPSPAPATVTVTITVCPSGFIEISATTCRTTLPYTFDVKAYTYHQEPTGPAPLLDSYETTAGACPTGYSLENYGWVTYCRRYGLAPTATVKDSTPAGYTDTGTTWSKKNDAPTGYTDDGTRWVRDVAKVTQVVPA